MESSELPSLPSDQLLVWMLGYITQRRASIRTMLYRLALDGFPFEISNQLERADLSDVIDVSVKHVRSLPGRDDVRNATLMALAEIESVWRSTSVYVDYSWAADSADGHWFRFMYVAKPDIESGLLQSSADVDSMLAVVASLQRAEVMANVLQFMVPDQDGEYFFSEGLDDRVETARGEFDLIAGGRYRLWSSKDKIDDDQPSDGQNSA